MSGPEINVIGQKLDDMKEFMNDRMDRLEKKVDGKCENCPTSIAFKERSRSQWWHIRAMWGALGTSLLTIIGYLYHSGGGHG